MIEVREATADEMVLTFLRGEIDSPAWIGRYTSGLGFIRADRAKLIDHGDLTDAQQNANRRAVLGAVRGYEQDQYLFKSFPGDTDWRLVTATPADVTRFKYMNQGIWIQLSSGTRRVAAGAQNLDQVQVKDKGIRDKVNGIAGDLRKGVGRSGWGQSPRDRPSPFWGNHGRNLGCRQSMARPSSLSPQARSRSMRSRLLATVGRRRRRRPSLCQRPLNRQSVRETAAGGNSRRSQRGPLAVNASPVGALA
jgi:hypothetical protein